MTHHEKGLTYILVAAALMSLDAVFIRLSGLHGFAPSFLFGCLLAHFNDHSDPMARRQCSQGRPSWWQSC